MIEHRRKKYVCQGCSTAPETAPMPAQSIYNLLQDQLLTSGYIHMDETPVQVLKELGKAASTNSTMWVRKTGDADQVVVLFDYEPTRSAAVVDKLLSDCQGYLQSFQHRLTNNRWMVAER